MSTSRNPVGWFEIYVQDMERARNFYQEKTSIGGYGFMAWVVDPDGNLIGLHSMA